MGTPVRVEKVVIRFPHLFEKHKAPGSDRLRYVAEFMVKKDQAQVLRALDNAFRKAAIEAGKGDSLEFLQSPVIRGSEANLRRKKKGKKPYPEIEDHWVFTAADPNYAPVVVARDGRTPIGVDRQDQVFSGCIVNAYVDFYWSNNQQNPGVFVGLRGVQIVDNVNPEKVSAGGGMSAEDMFQPLEENEPNGAAGPMFDDSTGYSSPAGFDDDIPF